MNEAMKIFHTSEGENEIAKAKAHKALASCYSELAKAQPKDYFRDCADAHTALADAHTASAESHIACCKGLEDIPVANESRTNADEQGPRGKSERDFLNLSGIAPDGVRFVFTKTASESAPAKSVLIPRTGSPAIESSTGNDYLELVLGEIQK